MMFDYTRIRFIQASGDFNRRYGRSARVLFDAADFGLQVVQGGLFFGIADGVIEHGDLAFDDADGFLAGAGLLQGGKLLDLLVALGVEVAQQFSICF
jgi:hypothetical protein